MLSNLKVHLTNLFVKNPSKLNITFISRESFWTLFYWEVLDSKDWVMVVFFLVHSFHCLCLFLLSTYLHSNCENNFKIITYLQVLSRDSVTVTVDAVVYYRVSNPTMATNNVEDFRYQCGLRLVRGSSLPCHLWWRRSLSRPLLQRARHVLLIIEYVLFVWVWPLVVCQGHHGISYLLKDPQDAFFLVSLIWFLKCCVPCCLIYLLLNYYHLATWKPIEVDWGC